MIHSAVLLAQLVTPNTQPGPVRLPGPNRIERPKPQTNDNNFEVDDALNQKGQSTPIQNNIPEHSSRSTQPVVVGELPYNDQQIKEIFDQCSRVTKNEERLDACAAALTTRLISDGYINSRVFVNSIEKNGQLELIEGRILEIRVTGPDERLNDRVQKQLEPLKKEALNIFTLNSQLSDIRNDRTIKRLQAQLKRLGSQVSDTSLVVSVEPREFPWAGLIKASNDGSHGTGEMRGVTILSKEQLFQRNDQFLLFTELNGNTVPDFGSFLGSVSYRFLVAPTIDLTLAGGFSQRRLIDSPSRRSLISYRTKQGTIQLDWNVHRSRFQNWSLFGSLSGDQTRLLVDGQPIKKKTTDLESVDREPRGAFARVGINGIGAGKNNRWMATLYALQGVSASLPDHQRQQRLERGVDVGKALSLGGQLMMEWDLSTSWMFKAELAGQVALNPLLPSMGFVLGADQGLLGLPAQWASGDSGWLGVIELPWTFADGKQGRFQLVPYGGGGGLRTNRSHREFTNSALSYGLLMRYQTRENNFRVDLGIVDYKSQNDDRFGKSQNTLLNRGLYLSTSYLF